MKSSLKTFLKKKNEYIDWPTCCLKDSKPACQVSKEVSATDNIGGDIWFTDVLDDGTAITYYPHVE